MSSRERFGREYIESELERIAATLATPVTAYLIGGGAMAFRDLKDTTKDIDLVVTNQNSYDRLLGTLHDLGYEEQTNLGTDYEQLGARHCVRNDDGCQIDLFNEQVAQKLFFSEEMGERSEPFISTDHLSVHLSSLEDMFLFKSVAGRQDDIGDMETLVQTGLDFGQIEAEIEHQVTLLGGEQFVTVIFDSLTDLKERAGIQTPLDETVKKYHHRYMNGLEVRFELREDTAIPLNELASELDVSTTKLEDRLARLEDFGFVERTEAGIRDTGKRGNFKQP